MTHRSGAATAGAAVALCVSVLGLQAQQKRTASAAPPARGLIVGRVVDAATNRPIAQAVVTLLAAASIVSTAATSGSPGPPRVYTDADGRFLFRDVAAGSFGITSTAPAYLDGGYGQARPQGSTRPFVLGEGQRIGDVTIRMWREATLAGTVTDETGAAVSGLALSLLGKQNARVVTNGRGQALARTDDRGAYQFAGLPPGDYLVSVVSRIIQWPTSAIGGDAASQQRLRDSGLAQMSASSASGMPLGDVVIQTTSENTWAGSNVLAAVLPMAMRADGRVVGYASTFYPSANTLAEASVITLRSGDEHVGADIRLRPVTMSRVRGTLTGPEGPRAGVAVHLIPDYAANQILERSHAAGVAVTNPKGVFEFLAVPPGPYVLKAWSLPQILVIGRDALPPDTTLWSETSITVTDAAVTDVALTMRPGVVLSGRVLYEGTAAPPNAQTTQTPLSWAFEPAWPLAFGARLATRVTPENQFQTQGLPAGRYFANFSNNAFFASLSARGWYFESATRGSQDLTIVPLVLEGTNINDIVITFSDRRSEIAGAVRTAAGTADSDAAIVVFPADHRAWIDNGLSPSATWSARTSQLGTFTLTVRPGDYLVAAVSEAILSTWPQAAAVETAARIASRVTIARGQSARLDLTRGGR